MRMICLMIVGLVAWSLAEYLIHRFVAHWRDRLCEHHAEPDDYTAGPSWVSVAAWLTIVAVVFPVGFSIGFVAGYIAYAWLHYQMHHGALCPRALRRNHNFHHWWDDHANFGVTSPVWDIVFGTYRKGRV